MPYITPDSPRTTGYGYRPDTPSIKDYIYSAPQAVLVTAPPVLDLRQQIHIPDPYQQRGMGSCTGHAIAGDLQVDMIKQGLPVVMPSRLFIYYNERSMENTIYSDAGAEIRDGIQSVATQGYCPEDMWPYEESRLTVAPTPDCYAYGQQHNAVQYERVMQDLVQMKGCLAALYPFVFGFTVYDAFESEAVAETGVLGMPQAGESVQGGHAVLCVGYDDTKQTFLVRNSWGTDWGMGGYFTIPYSYLLSPYLASDFWKITVVK